jgi:hypothetical protein
MGWAGPLEGAAGAAEGFGPRGLEDEALRVRSRRPAVHILAP